jgi:hypothetical protein
LNQNERLGIVSKTKKIVGTCAKRTLCPNIASVDNAIIAIAKTSPTALKLNPSAMYTSIASPISAIRIFLFVLLASAILALRLTYSQAQTTKGNANQIIASYLSYGEPSQDEIKYGNFINKGIIDIAKKIIFRLIAIFSPFVFNFP